MLTINNQQFKYPILCISVVDKYLVFTTKKTGSRYFEDISSDVIDVTQKKSINLHLDDIQNNNTQTDFIFFNYEFKIFHNEKLLNLQEFNDLLKIDKIYDIFSDKVMNNFEYVFVTRNPLDRLFTGFFEKIGSIVNVLHGDIYNQFLFDIIKNYFKINEYTDFNKLPQDKINLILNQFALSIDYKLLDDEHLSLWNYFLFNFLQKENLLSKVKIIDLSDIHKMNNFPKLDQPSNKLWLSNWMHDEKNKYYIDTMLLNLKPYMDLEIESYNILLNKTNG
jgi:hypothetical protein